MKQETKLIDISKLLFSKTNPRTLLVKFNNNDPDFLDLCSSIETHGVIESILVRPISKGFEVVNGERRVRACKKLNIKKVKAEVRKLTDEETIELQIIGFDHRKGIHPLAEASAIKALMDLGNTSIKTISDRIGKKPSYIAQTLHLLNLIDSAKELFAQGKIELGHARIVCKQQPADQTKILKHLEQSNFRQSAESLAGWVHGTFMLNLNKAPFKTKDSILLQDAGSCIDCKKRTGSDPDLFPEISGANICTDPACYKKKVEAHIDLALHHAETQGKALYKIDSSLFSHTKKDVLGRNDFEDYEPKKHKKDWLDRAIVVKGNNVGEFAQIVRKENLPVEEKKTEPQKPPTPKEIADQENEIIKEKREALLREQLGQIILKHDLKKQIFPPIARAMLNQIQGDFISDYFFFSENADLKFDKMNDEHIIESFNGGAVAEASNEESNYPIEFLIECCGFLGIAYKEIKETIWNENQLLTSDDIKKRLKESNQSESHFENMA